MWAPYVGCVTRLLQNDEEGGAWATLANDAHFILGHEVGLTCPSARALRTSTVQK